MNISGSNTTKSKGFKKGFVSSWLCLKFGSGKKRVKLTAGMKLVESSPFGSKLLTRRRVPLMRSELPDQLRAVVNQTLMASLNSRLRGGGEYAA